MLFEYSYFEYGAKIEFDFEEVGNPIRFNWGKCPLATASFGHGITTTPLQLARAYAILGNGGFEIEPSILKKETNYLEKRKKIISDETSNKLNLMLRKVVSLDEGTANFANIEGYEVAGKTGTSMKYNSNEKLNTFVSIFPASRPEYVLLVMLDEPKPAPNYVYHFPPSDNRWRDEPSDTFVSYAAERLHERNGIIANIDVTIICESPLIAPHRESMQNRLAAMIGVDPMRVNVKGTTTERLGFTGRGEGISALATATVRLPFTQPNTCETR